MNGFLWFVGSVVVSGLIFGFCVGVVWVRVVEGCSVGVFG